MHGASDGIWDDCHMRYQGLIAAAGRSSRMDGFKPLMRLNGFPMIQMTVQSLRNGGIEDITVVTGCRAQEMEEVLRPLHVRIVENQDFASTDMLASVRMGLRQIKDADVVFFLPGDVPLVAPKSIQKMKERLSRQLDADGLQVLQPIVGVKEAHPPALLRGGVDMVLSYQGEGGLRGAFNSMQMEQMELLDTGALADADVRADFERLLEYAKKKRGVSLSVCEELYEEAGLLEHIRRHCKAVGDLAASMAERLIAHGACLDVELCRSGGYLHDLCKLSGEHEAAAGNFLRERGYQALAKVVERHKGFLEEPLTVCEEWVLVCLADKLVQEEQRVTIEKRYEKALGHASIKPWIVKNITICKKLIKEFEVITGERL